MTLGGIVWGLMAERRGVAFALDLASAGTAASILLRFFARRRSIARHGNCRPPFHLCKPGSVMDRQIR